MARDFGGTDWYSYPSHSSYGAGGNSYDPVTAAVIFRPESGTDTYGGVFARGSATQTMWGIVSEAASDTDFNFYINDSDAPGTIISLTLDTWYLLVGRVRESASVFDFTAYTMAGSQVATRSGTAPTTMGPQNLTVTLSHYQGGRLNGKIARAALWVDIVSLSDVVGFMLRGRRSTVVRPVFLWDEGRDLIRNATPTITGSPTQTANPGGMSPISTLWARRSTLVYPTAGGAITIIPSGLASGGAFGAARIVSSIVPSGLASGGAFGSARVVSRLAPSGIGSAEALGTALVRQAIAATGIGSSEALGAHTVATAWPISSAGAIASGEVLGGPTIRHALSPGGIGTGEAMGGATVVAAWPIVGAGGIAGGQAFGTALLRSLVSPGGIGSSEALGTALLRSLVSPGGIGSSEAIGSPAIELRILAAGLASSEAIGSHLVQLAGGAQTISPPGIGSGSSLGIPVVVADWLVATTGISSAESIGAALLRQAVATPGIGSSEALGVPGFALQVVPAGVPGGGVFGAVSLTWDVLVSPSGIGGGSFGQAVLVIGLLVVPRPPRSGSLTGPGRGGTIATIGRSGGITGPGRVGQI